MANAALMTRTLAAVRQPPDLLTRKTRKTISRGMPSDLDSAAAASSSPASAQAHTGGVGHHRPTATPNMTRNPQSAPLLIKLSNRRANSERSPRAHAPAAPP